MKQILIYLGDQQHKKEILTNILTQLNIQHTFLNDDALCETVGYLFQLPSYEKSTNDSSSFHFTNDLMLFEEVSDDEIKQMNEAFQKANIQMQKKAMLTNHNASWLLKDLIQEIEEEHAYFKKREELYELLAASSSLIIEHYTPESWKQYEQAFYIAYEVYAKQVEPSVLYDAYDHLKYAKEHLVKK